MTFLALLAAFGVFMHDGRVDRAAATAINKPIQIKFEDIAIGERVRTFMDGDAHTHPDHNAARASLLNSFQYQSPSIPPRNQEQKKHLMQECQPRGHHAFDNYNLPIVI